MKIFLNSTARLKTADELCEFLLYAAKWSGGGGGRGERDDFVCLDCDGDICLKIRIKPLNIYLGVELIKTNNHIRAIVIFIVLKRC